MIQVNHAGPADVADVAGLLEEMDRFYGVTDFEPANVRQDQIHALIFGTAPAGHVILARDGADLVGLTSYTFLWPAVGLTRSLFLKELYVHRAHRGHGVGRALIDRVFQIAADTGCSRIEWMTERTNDDARAFYQRLGFQVNAEKVFYRVER